MSVRAKQDGTYTRTASDLERKYNFGKTFSEMLGLINESRDHTDSVESTLRNEITEQATALRRDTEQIVMEATQSLVKESDFDTYKTENSAQLQLMANRFSVEIEETTELVDELSQKVDGIDSIYFYIRYSKFADGHIMTDAPDDSTLYMGTCSTNSPTAPIDYEEYTWTKVKGDDAILIMIDSSAGNLFKNSLIATTLTVTIIVGNLTITDSTTMRETFGSQARLKWQQMNMGETEYTDIAEDDSRLSDDGFILTLNANDVTTKAIFNCILDF